MLYCVCVKQKTAYEMRISDWSSDVCSSDLLDLDLDQVAVLHADRRVALGADAARRAGGDHIARLQRDEGGHIGDDLADVEGHQLGVRRLHHLAVQPALDVELLLIAPLLGGDRKSVAQGTSVSVRVELVSRRIHIKPTPSLQP